jgi:hypothetical protein
MHLELPTATAVTLRTEGDLQVPPLSIERKIQADDLICTRALCKLVMLRRTSGRCMAGGIAETLAQLTQSLVYIILR